MRDDDALANIDLSTIDLGAWEPPAPPASLVDDVIARAAAMPALVESVPRPPAIAHASRAKRWWIAGGIAAAVTAVAAIGLWGIERAPSHTSHVAETPNVDRAQADVDLAKIASERARLLAQQQVEDQKKQQQLADKGADAVIAAASAEVRDVQLELARTEELVRRQVMTQRDRALAQAAVEDAVARLGYVRGFVAACNAKLADRAKHFYGKLPAATRTQLAPLCVRNGITFDAAPR